MMMHYHHIVSYIIKLSLENYHILFQIYNEDQNRHTGMISFNA
jgi:hypothetical protein